MEKISPSETELDSPLVSVILPVFNEASFISETINAISCQTYDRVEILISDNNSSDSTADICKDWAQKDSRVKFYKQDSNIGVHENHRFLIGKSRGEYIIWASGHDRWSENYLAETLAALENDHNAVLSYGTPCWIDEEGETLDRNSGWYDTRGLSVVTRFCFVFWGKPNPILGLYRKEKFPDLGNYNFVGADLVILCVLGLKGVFIHSVNATLYRRQNRGKESYQSRMKRYHSEDININRSRIEAVLPLLYLPFRILRTVLQSEIRPTEKFLICTLLFVSIPVKFISEKYQQK